MAVRAVRGAIQVEADEPAEIYRGVREMLAAVLGHNGLATDDVISIFFTATPVRDYATALTGDAKLFAKFFHACLARGVYLAPSAYEAGFLSTAHEGPAIDRACEIFAAAIKEL